MLNSHAPPIANRVRPMTPHPRFAQHPEHLAALRAAALRAADPAEAVRRAFQPADFAQAENIYVVGMGKAGVAMGETVAEILGDRLTIGVIAVPHLPTHQVTERLTYIEGGHPLPNGGSLVAGATAAEILKHTTERDLVIALISGGGSALMELPPVELNLEDLQSTTTALLRCGAAVHEINIVRAQLSHLKGGGLARLAYPARVLSLILSDVVGNPIEAIASGPTMPIASSRLAALEVIQQYLLQPSLSRKVWAYLNRPADIKDRRNLNARPTVLPIEQRIIGSNRLAGEAAAAQAAALGFKAQFLADDWQGEARQAGERFASLVKQTAEQLAQAATSAVPHCLIVGGETTVTIRGAGKGGRNQEVALAAALALDGQSNIVISTLATDGVDGPTDAAGAVVTGATLMRAHDLGLSAQKCLEHNNSYLFFSVLDDLVRIGPTGTNVNDLMIGLVYCET